MKMPRRTREIELDGDYKGFKCTVLLSAPMNVFSYVRSGDFDLIQAALKKILISWNFNDEEGKPLPQPGEMVIAYDIFGRPMVEQRPIIKKGVDTGEVETIPLKISAVSLLPQDLAMKILEKAMTAINETPTP